MKRVLVSLVSILSVFQIGCGVEFEDPGNEVTGPLPSVLATNINGLYITSNFCADKAYKLAPLNELFIEIEPKAGTHGLSSGKSGGEGFELFIIDPEKQVNNTSVSSFFSSEQEESYLASKELCESGVEISEFTNSLKIFKSGHFMNPQFSTHAFAMSQVHINTDVYVFSANYTEYKCIDSQIVNVKEGRENSYFYRVTENDISSVESLRSIYDEKCPNN